MKNRTGRGRPDDDWFATRDADNYFEEMDERIDAARSPGPEPAPETPDGDRSTSNDDIPF